MPGKSTTKNILRIFNPTVSKEWHATKNGILTPREVTAGSDKKVWWQCSKGHKWGATIKNRNKGTGCLTCYRQRSNHL